MVSARQPVGLALCLLRVLRGPGGGSGLPDRRPVLSRLHCARKLGRKLVWGFCASYGVYLLSVFLPNVIHLSAGAMLMTLFGGGVVLVMAATAAPLKRLGGEPIVPDKVRRVLLGAPSISGSAIR